MLLLVVVLHGGAGVERVQFLLRCLRLDTRVACSRAHLPARARERGAQVRAFGVEQTVARSATRPPRTVRLCADETGLAGTLILVAHEPVSGWRWVPQIAATRDEATWTAAVRAGTRGMAVTLRTVGADGAGGLVARAVSGLQIPHRADVFHGPSERTKGYRRRLSVRVQAAEAAHPTAVAATQARRAEHRAEARGERGPGRPRDGASHLAVADPAPAEREAALRRARADQETMREVVRGLGEVVHPVDLATGTRRAGDAVAHTLDGLLARARGVAATLGEGRTKAVAKVPKRVPNGASRVRAWWTAVDARVAAEGLSAGLTALVVGGRVPAMYVAWVRERNHLDRAARTPLGTVADARLAQVRAHAEWQALPPETRRHLVARAQDCAPWFVRSTGSTEGHHGWWRLRFHPHHAVSPPWWETQRVLHNFLIRRADGTTAAERFFGTAPGDLIEDLVARMPWPALPRRRKARRQDVLAHLNL